jgi:methyl-accepting chemotaxis protein
MRISRLSRANLIREVVLFVMIAAILSVFSSLTLNARLTEEFTNRGTAIANSIASSSVELLMNRDASTIQSTIDQYIDPDDPSVAYVFVVDDQEQFIAHTFVPGIPPEVKEVAKGQHNQTITRDLTVADYGDYKDVCAPILAGVVGYVHVGMDKGIIQDKIRDAVLEQVGLIAGIFCVGIVIAYVQANQISRPLLQLAGYARDIASDRVALQSEKELQTIARRRDEVGQLTRDFQHMVQEVQEREQGLEERTRALERRTAQLQAAAEVSRTAISVHDPDALLSRVCNLIGERFGFDYVGIFLVDGAGPSGEERSEGEYAVLCSARRESDGAMAVDQGRAKVEQGSVVEQAMTLGEPRVVLGEPSNDPRVRRVGLAEAQSEMALPLKAGGRTIGVLDVQNLEEATFDQDDVTALQTMADQLAIGIENARLLHTTQRSLKQLNAAVTEILSVTTQQVAGAKQQSAAISQTTTTVDEVRAIAEQTAQRAESVAELAQQVSEVSLKGQHSVANTIQGMQDVRDKVGAIASDILSLSEQSQAVGQIIASVSEIASQSNLLALNAAVEAARAGEAGRGFAVVAQEVRSLAEQSRAATRQVEEILTQIQHGVNTAVMATEEGMKGAEAGMKLAGEAGLSIQRLTESVTASTQAAAQIAAAAGQQQAGVEQIAMAMENIHQVTAQNEAGAQQSERAVGELSNLAGQLRELVEQYRVA